jgi:hypothetical protein
VKEQTKMRIEILYDLIGQQKEDNQFDKERLLKMTEICHLLKEDVEVGEQTSQIIEEIGDYGQEALKQNEDLQKEQYLKANERKMNDHYLYLKKVMEE